MPSKTRWRLRVLLLFEKTLWFEDRLHKRRCCWSDELWKASLSPGGLAHLVLGSDVVQNFGELASDFIAVEIVIDEASDDGAGLLSPAVLGQPTRCFWKEGADDEDDESEENLACHREPPLEGAFGEEGCKTEPGCNGDTWYCKNIRGSAS